MSTICVLAFSYLFLMDDLNIPECNIPDEIITIAGSWYDPALGGINCDLHCWNIGAFIPLTDDRYGTTLACPEKYYGAFFDVSGSRWGLADGRWECLDAGGAIRVLLTGVVRVDFLSKTPIWYEELTARVFWN